MFSSLKKFFRVVLLFVSCFCVCHLYAVVKVKATGFEWKKMIKAIEDGDLNTVKKMLRNGNFNLGDAKSRGGYTLVEIAKHNKQSRIASVIKKHYSVQATKIKNFMEDNQKKKFTVTASRADWSDMLRAIEGADYKTVKKLFKKFESSLAKTRGGRTLLSVALFQAKKYGGKKGLHHHGTTLIRAPGGRNIASTAQLTAVSLREIKRIKADGSTKAILFYDRGAPFYEFTNFYVAPFIDKQGKTWATSEHYFQACKFLDVNKQEKIRLLRRPRDVFRYANSKNGIWRKDIRKDWRTVCDQVMKDALYMKFSQNPSLKQLLIDTGICPLVENSPYDPYWGVGPKGNGKNKLGLSLMQLRQFLISQGG